MKDGKRTDIPIRRFLRPDEQEGVDYFIKPDPNFEEYTYSVCHRQLREVIQPHDLLFFRTLWRQRQYLIGFFTIADKSGPEDNPVLHGDPDHSLLIDFALPISKGLARRINPHTTFNKNAHENAIINGRLGRNYIKLTKERAELLKHIVRSSRTSLAEILEK